MDVNEMRTLKPQLRRYLKEFDDCFARKDTRGHLPVYIEGQLSDLERKSVESGGGSAHAARVSQSTPLGPGSDARTVTAASGQT